MEPQEVRRHLEETGALLTGHFLLSSGLHSGRYFQCARVLAWPARAGLLGRALAERWEERPVDLVVGPAMGGIVIAYEVARSLGTPSIFAEREGGHMALRRGFAVEPGTRVLVVEDVVTTGGSAREVVELLRSLRAEVVGVGCMVWRAPVEDGGGPPPSPFGDLAFESLLTESVDARPPRECPQCREGKPFEKPGSRSLRAAGAHEL